MKDLHTCNSYVINMNVYCLHTHDIHIVGKHTCTHIHTCTNHTCNTCTCTHVTRNTYRTVTRNTFFRKQKPKQKQLAPATVTKTENSESERPCTTVWSQRSTYFLPRLFGTCFSSFPSTFCSSVFPSMCFVFSFLSGTK